MEARTPNPIEVTALDRQVAKYTRYRNWAGVIWLTATVFHTVVGHWLYHVIVVVATIGVIWWALDRAYYQGARDRAKL